MSAGMLIDWPSLHVCFRRHMPAVPIYQILCAPLHWPCECRLSVKAGKDASGQMRGLTSSVHQLSHECCCSLVWKGMTPDRSHAGC